MDCSISMDSAAYYSINFQSQTARLQLRTLRSTPITDCFLTNLPTPLHKPSSLYARRLPFTPSNNVARSLSIYYTFCIFSPILYIEITIKSPLVVFSFLFSFLTYNVSLVCRDIIIFCLPIICWNCMLSILIIYFSVNLIKTHIRLLIILPDMNLTLNVYNSRCVFCMRRAMLLNDGRCRCPRVNFTECQGAVFTDMPSPARVWI